MPNEESHSDPHDENQESVLRLHFGNDVLQSDEILSSKISERLEDNFASRTSSIVANPKDTSRWDYHAQVRLYGPEGLYEDEGILQTGICVSSKLQDDGSLEITVQGAKWELERAIVAGFETFGMTDTESVYWLTLFDGARSRYRHTWTRNRPHFASFHVCHPNKRADCKWGK